MGQGFTKTNKLDNIDNIGAYLTAYLGDMELTQENLQELEKNGLKMANIKIKEVNEIENIKLKEPKSFIKGGRLYMYPLILTYIELVEALKSQLKNT